MTTEGTELFQKEETYVLDEQRLEHLIKHAKLRFEGNKPQHSSLADGAYALKVTTWLTAYGDTTEEVVQNVIDMMMESEDVRQEDAAKEYVVHIAEVLPLIDAESKRLVQISESDDGSFAVYFDNASELSAERCNETQEAWEEMFALAVTKKVLNGAFIEDEDTTWWHRWWKVVVPLGVLCLVDIGLNVGILLH